MFLPGKFGKLKKYSNDFLAIKKNYTKGIINNRKQK